MIDILQILGYGSTIDDSILELIHIPSHNFAPELIIVNVSVYLDKALLLDFYW